MVLILISTTGAFSCVLLLLIRGKETHLIRRGNLEFLYFVGALGLIGILRRRIKVHGLIENTFLFRLIHEMEREKKIRDGDKMKKQGKERENQNESQGG